MIYFIRAVGLRLVKIGYTHSHPIRRLENLRTGSPVRLIGMALMVGDKSTESAIHNKFDRDRSHGEWFRLSVELKDFIELNAKKWRRTGLGEFLSPEEREAAKRAEEAQDEELKRVLYLVRGHGFPGK